MEYGKLLSPTNLTSTIVDDSYQTFDNTLGVPKGTLRLYYDNRIYEARTNIYPLATYSWNEYSTATDAVVTRLADKVEVTNTSVSCVQNSTIVYIEDSSDDSIVGKFFKYTGASGNVNFTTVNTTTHSDFEEVKNYRAVDSIPPNVDESSVYWKFVNVLNSVRHLDGTLWNKTVGSSAGVITNYYTLNNYVNTIAFFSLDCTSVEVTVRKESDNSILIDTQTIDLMYLGNISSSYEWHYSESGVFLENTFLKLDIYTNIIIQIDFINTNYAPEIGEVIFSRTKSMGKTLNRPQGIKKTYDTISIDDDGKKTVVKSNTMKDDIQYRVSVDTEVIDGTITEWASLINENILIIGDESGEYTNLINYGSINEMPYEIDSSSSKNTYQITVTTLI